MLLEHFECLKALDLCVCMCYCTNRYFGSRRRGVKKNQKQQWVDRTGSQRTIPSVDVQAIPRLFHELLTAKLFCVPHNKNNGDKWGKLREKMASVRECVSHHQQRHIICQLAHLYEHYCLCYESHSDFNHVWTWETPDFHICHIFLTGVSLTPQCHFIFIMNFCADLQVLSVSDV